MLKKRIMTALVLIPITVFLLFYLSPPLFCFLIGLITLGAAWEWSNLMEVKSLSRRILYLIIMALMLFVALYLPVLLILLFAAIWWLFATVLIIFYPKGSGWWSQRKLIRGVMGVFVLVPCFTALNFIRNQSDGIYAILFLFVLIWGADSAAYFTGKKWGKNKLAPLVSPGKSIQGLGGAIVSSLVITLVALWLGQVSIQLWVWAMMLSVVTVLFSVVGDLFESMLKRQAGLKDSGQLLPGHGGLLDRIDSLTAAAPMFAVGAVLLGMLL